MKPEDAIEILTLMKRQVFAGSESDNALDMAIEALQAKTDGDTISRQAAIEELEHIMCDHPLRGYEDEQLLINAVKSLPSAEPERLTDDDFETIRIHLNACKEKLCNQQRWEEAEEYQRIIDRFMSFASAQPGWIPVTERLPEEDGLYIVTTSKGQVQVHVFSHNGNSEEYWMRCDKAWMPLPEPWKGDKDGI